MVDSSVVAVIMLTPSDRNPSGIEFNPATRWSLASELATLLRGRNLCGRHNGWWAGRETTPAASSGTGKHLDAGGVRQRAKASGRLAYPEYVPKMQQARRQPRHHRR
jgi:hypothetical protein